MCPNDGSVGVKKSQKNGKKTRCVKVRNVDENLVLGVGVKLDEIMETTGRVIVGQVRGRHYSAARWKIGDLETRGKYFPAMPKESTLSR